MVASLGWVDVRREDVPGVGRISDRLWSEQAADAYVDDVTSRAIGATPQPRHYAYAVLNQPSFAEPPRSKAAAEMPNGLH